MKVACHELTVLFWMVVLNEAIWTVLCPFDMWSTFLPSSLNVDSRLSDSSCSQFLWTKHSRDVERSQPSARLRKLTVGSEAGKFLIRCTFCLRETQRKNKPSSAWKSSALFLMRNKEAQNATLLGQKFVKKQSSKGQASQRKIVEKQCGKASDNNFHCLEFTSAKVDDEVLDGPQVSRRSVHLECPWRKFAGLNRRGRPLARR